MKSCKLDIESDIESYIELELESDIELELHSLLQCYGKEEVLKGVEKMKLNVISHKGGARNA